ncbi:MAG TPA: hypothetical protein VJI73_00380 [Candidatus Paceibacterota bacterium]
MLIYDRFIEVLLPALKGIFFYFGPYALVPLLCYASWLLWIRYMRMHYIFNGGWTLMEVILPKLAVKSPQSMEVIFGTFNQAYAGNWWNRIRSGSLRTWFSLEIVSIEGRVHFFIRTSTLFKHAIEVAIYGEYPNARVNVVEDYMKGLKYYKNSNLDVYLWELGLGKKDPYPIRTYVDYGLDKEGVEEEYRTDPITPIIEFLSSLGPKEYAVVQILVMTAKDRYKLKVGVKGDKKKKKGMMGDWRDEGRELIAKIIEEKTGGKKDKDKKGEVDFSVFKLTPVDTEEIKAIDKSMAKNGYDCGIRLLYAAEKQTYKLEHRLAFKSLFNVFNAHGLNSFKIKKETGINSVLGNITGWNEHKVAKMKKEMFNACRLRSYFYPPYSERPFVLNSEELATVYHFSPGASIGAGVERVESKTLEPPLELPE